MLQCRIISRRGCRCWRAVLDRPTKLDRSGVPGVPDVGVAIAGSGSGSGRQLCHVARLRPLIEGLPAVPEAGPLDAGLAGRGVPEAAVLALAVLPRPELPFAHRVPEGETWP